MATLPLPTDLTPTSIENLTQQLPAQLRAELNWFPAQLRSDFIEPLRKAGPHWQKIFDEVGGTAARLLLRLGASTIRLLQNPSFSDLFCDPTATVKHHQKSCR